MRLTKEKLKELQAANHPHATPELLGVEIRDDAPDRAVAEGKIALLADYLKQFLPPSKCIGCGSRLGAKDAVDAFLGGDGVPTFQWGITHGEGSCSKCGYPARAMHYIGKAEGEPEITIQNLILQYHPSTLE